LVLGYEGARKLAYRQENGAFAPRRNMCRVPTCLGDSGSDCRTSSARRVSGESGKGRQERGEKGNAKWVPHGGEGKESWGGKTRSNSNEGDMRTISRDWAKIRTCTPKDIHNRAVELITAGRGDEAVLRKHGPG